MANRKVPNFTARVTRDTVLFITGILGIGYETILVHVDRPTLLILFGGMVGLPVFLRQDEKKPEPPDPGPSENKEKAGDES